MASSDASVPRFQRVGQRQALRKGIVPESLIGTRFCIRIVESGGFSCAYGSQTGLRFNMTNGGNR